MENVFLVYGIMTSEVSDMKFWMVFTNLTVVQFIAKSFMLTS
jgi:hypothetical protein